MNYRTRLTLLTCAAITVTLVAASIGTYSLARHEAYDQIDTALDDRIVLTRAFQKADDDRRASDPAYARHEAACGHGPPIPGTRPGQAGGYTRTLANDGTIVRPERHAPNTGTACGGSSSSAGAGSGSGSSSGFSSAGTSSSSARQPSQPHVDPDTLPARVRDQFRQIDAELPITAAARSLAQGSSHHLLHETVRVGGSTYRLVSGRVTSDYVSQAARPLDETNDFLDRLALLLALVTIGGIGVGVAAALVVTRTASAPVHRLTELTAAVRESGDLSKRVAVRSHDDLGRLAHSVNSMLEELERAAVRQQQLVDDASHQLRTPLASIRTNMDVLLRTTNLDETLAREILDDLSAQTDELTALVRDLVDLAANVESDLDREPVRLDEIALEAVRRVRGVFDQTTFETDVRESVVRGSEERLVRMVQNLLHNAGKWSPDGGTVTVRVRGGEIRVIDHGSGVRDEEKRRVFERFHRAADARDVPGSGLGLAIVEQVAIDHGGSARVEDTPGGGATFIVRIPLHD
jgi:two-component system sensor histidine kinase MprB